jgi:hypothetical protein
MVVPSFLIPFFLFLPKIDKPGFFLLIPFDLFLPLACYD